MSHANISVFVPHLGCPNRCSFCDQVTISGAFKQPTKEDVVNLESGLIFVGMVGMIDPPRPEAKLAVDKCKTAGIKTVMITGDHRITATAIAKQLGILDNEDEAITGADVEKMTQEDLEKNITKYSVK